MPSYVDRGLIKWGAFDALNGYSSMLADLRHRLGKQEKPSLSEDALEELNQNLQRAWMEHLEIEVRYYADGYFRNTYGTIQRVDFNNRVVFLSTKEKLHAEEIMEITIL
ncbi:MAG: YolD-like family protein [bacterium]|nr:YolD-like family protein [bacterium]